MNKRGKRLAQELSVFLRQYARKAYPNWDPYDRRSDRRILHLGANYGVSAQRIARARRLIEEHEDEIRTAWRRHFAG